MTIKIMARDVPAQNYGAFLDNCEITVKQVIERVPNLYYTFFHVDFGPSIGNADIFIMDDATNKIPEIKI